MEGLRGLAELAARMGCEASLTRPPTSPRPGSLMAAMGITLPPIEGVRGEQVVSGVVSAEPPPRTTGVSARGAVAPPPVTSPLSGGPPPPDSPPEMR